MSLRIAVTGRHGQLAMALAERAAFFAESKVISVGRPDLDLEMPDTVEPALRAVYPGLIVNAAAYTDVDKAEAEPARAFAINHYGAEAVARAAARLGVPLIHISTDYVYDGNKGTPYIETDPTGPVNIYGLSKLAGEAAVRAAHPSALILRTSWVFSAYGTNFVKTMLRLGAECTSLRVVNDQYGNPTAAQDLAAAILVIASSLTIEATSGGIYHFCGKDSTSWYSFARYIFAESAIRSGAAPFIQAISTAAYPTAARRPADTRLDTSAFTRRFGFAPPPWHAAISKILKS